MFSCYDIANICANWDVNARKGALQSIRYADIIIIVSGTHTHTKTSHIHTREHKPLIFNQMKQVCAYVYRCAFVHRLIPVFVL